MSREEREKKVADVIAYIKEHLGNKPFMCLMKVDDGTTNVFGACTEEDRIDLITSMIGQLLRDKGPQELMSLITRSFAKRDLFSDEELEELGVKNDNSESEEEEFSDHVRINRKKPSGLLDYVRDRLRDKSTE